MPRISSQVGGPGWFLEFLKELFEKVAGLSLFIFFFLTV